MSAPRTMSIALVVCLAGLAGAAHGQEVKLSEDARTTARGNNVFAAELYAQLSKEQGNLFFSPYSISSALAMTYGGARGQTAEEMATTLHFTLGQERLHPAMGQLVKYFNATGKDRPYQLSVANSLWGQKGYHFLPEFLKLTGDHYDARLTDLDFVGKTEEARQTINQWVEKKTQDRIKDLIPKNILGANTKLVLTNAIYFKSAWFDNFNKAATKPADFTLAAGDRVKVPMMHKVENLPYLDGDAFRMVNVPYQGNALSLIVLLPEKAAGLPALEKSLTSANLERWLGQMKPHKVDLKLPKFKTTSQFQLADVLKKMGMKRAFGDADFSGLSTQSGLRITAVIHKAFVDVHEEGTEAAAATAVGFGDSKPPTFPAATFHADRPFVFLIRDNQTGSILFMGRVSNPRAS